MVGVVLAKVGRCAEAGPGFPLPVSMGTSFAENNGLGSVSQTTTGSRLALRPDLEPEALSLFPIDC